MNALLYVTDTYNPTFHETVNILQGPRGHVVVKAYSTNRQVAGSIPDGVTGIFQ